MRPLKEIRILPGLFTVKTDRGSVARWKSGDKVRFHNSLPQKLGGWVKNSVNAFLGKCRALMGWRSIVGTQYMGFGTHLKLYAWSGGTFYNITPLSSSGTYANNPITTTISSALVSIAHTAHGRLAGDYLTISGATAVGGITISGEYAVTSVTSVDAFVITHSSAATSSATGGGASVAYSYEIPIGAENDSSFVTGWGGGTWGAGTWGTARTTTNTTRLWSFDLWGEDLIANYRGGGIYAWDTSAGTGTRAAAISGAPSTAKLIMTSQENKHLIAFGAHSGTTDDPLLIRWSTSEDYTSWTASSVNSAGSKRLQTGNEIMCAVKTRKEILVFTDSHLWTMVFVGPPYTFNFEPIGSNGAIISQNAAQEANGVVYWMGEEDFFYYDGGINTLPCDVWPTVFEDINDAHESLIVSGYNREYSEIWWFYPASGSTENDRYVIYSTTEKTWSAGTLARTAYLGNTTGIVHDTYAAGTDGYLYNHESGTSNDGTPFTSTLESYDFEIGEGDYVGQVGMFVPDFKELTGGVTVTLKARKFPHSAQTSDTSIAVTSSTEYVNPRIKGRQLAIEVESTGASDHWVMGTNRIGVRPHGKR